jgi:hypothetical protein
MGFANKYSAPAHGDDDFKLVAGEEFRIAKLATRYDFPVALDRKASAGQVHSLEQLRNVERSVKGLARAVYGKFNHLHLHANVHSQAFDFTTPG